MALSCRQKFAADTAPYHWSYAASICSYNFLRYNRSDPRTPCRESSHECHCRPPGRVAGPGLVPRALPAWVYNHPRDDAPRIRADPEAELADRLPHQLDPERRRLHDLRTGLRQRDRAARAAGATSGRSTTSAAIAARACSTAPAIARAASPARITAGPTATTDRCSRLRRGELSRLWTCASMDSSRCAWSMALGFVFVCLAAEAPAATLTDLGAVPRRVRASSVRGDGAARTALHRALGCRLEDRDGQLPRVLSRAHRPSGPEPHVHARLRGPARLAAASRAASAGCARRPRRAGASACTAVRRRGDRAASARAAPARWSFYSMLPNLGHRRRFPTRWISSRCCRAGRARR